MAHEPGRSAYSLSNRIVPVGTLCNLVQGQHRIRAGEAFVPSQTTFCLFRSRKQHTSALPEERMWRNVELLVPADFFMPTRAPWKEPVCEASTYTERLYNANCCPCPNQTKTVSTMPVAATTTCEVSRPKLHRPQLYRPQLYRPQQRRAELPGCVSCH